MLATPVDFTEHPAGRPRLRTRPRSAHRRSAARCTNRMTSVRLGEMEKVILRPVESHDLDHLLQLQWEPSAAGEFQWFGFRMDTVRELERRWQQDGLMGGAESYLAVGVDDGGVRGGCRGVPLDPLGTTRSGSRCSRNTEAAVSARKHNVSWSGICSRTRPRSASSGHGDRQPRRATRPRTRGVPERRHRAGPVLPRRRVARQRDLRSASHRHPLVTRLRA